MTPHNEELSLTPLIEDIVSTSTSAEFRNDVQLLQYRSQQNLELASDFIFTWKAAQGCKSAIELLKHLCEAFMPGLPPNRFVFIATYGHGKSHLAVAIANYFGKELDSPELQSVLARISHALPDAPLFGFFEAFKRNQRPLMILILRGDEPSDLQTKFFRAVEDALRSDFRSGGVQTPFWYADAERFVRSVLEGPQDPHKSADLFLSKYDLDLTLLLDRICAQDASTYEITRALCQHLNKFVPDFGIGLSLKEAIVWLGTNLVGPNKPYGGVLILFDEFSSFVHDYAVRIRHQHGAPLQDLLNGVDVMKGRIAFAAFAQRDPDRVAQSLLSGDSLQSLTTQLNRLPSPQRYQVHSSLEEVLDSYLKQDQGLWRQLLKDSTCRAMIEAANDLSFEIFSGRYQDALEWDLEHFQQVVTHGCFPLHPSTTALLSSVEFETSSNPRSVLGFVHTQLEGMKRIAAWSKAAPNWILPIALVNYFGAMLGEKPWLDYRDALAEAGGPDASPERVAVLKGMLLQASGRVATKGLYARVIAQFAGLDVQTASKELHQLSTGGVIRYDTTNKIYSFWPAGRGANKVDQLLVEKLRKLALDETTLDIALKLLKDESLFNSISVPVPWGHPDDWQAELVAGEADQRCLFRRGRRWEMRLSRCRWGLGCTRRCGGWNGDYWSGRWLRPAGTGAGRRIYCRLIAGVCMTGCGSLGWSSGAVAVTLW